jgi:hypothetical protein
MLFLAVTGTLAAAILAGSGIAISQQRYRDSVSSLKSYIQQQYSEVTNVMNDRDKSWSCDGLGSVSQTVPSGGEARGTSDCVILGRYMTIDATGTKLAASNVIGFRNAGATDAASDIAEITTNYKLGISPIDAETDEVSWGAQVVKQKSSTPMPLTVLVLRSPLSGSIMTFTADGIQTDLTTLVSGGNMEQKDLCVNADAGSFVGNRMEIRIDAFATNQSAIQTPPESSSLCD